MRGATKLTAPVQTDRAMKASNAPNPFDFNQELATQTFLDALFNQPDATFDLSLLAGRYPGSWTIPVCDASTWGKAWNWNYVDDEHARGATKTHPPCLCGKHLRFILQDTFDHTIFCTPCPICLHQDMLHRENL